MNLEPSAEQKLLQETLSRIFREQSTGVRIRQCEQLGPKAGFDADLWRTLSELEVPMLRVPGDLGGVQRQAGIAEDQFVDGTQRADEAALGPARGRCAEAQRRQPAQQRTQQIGRQRAATVAAGAAQPAQHHEQPGEDIDMDDGRDVAGQ